MFLEGQRGLKARRRNRLYPEEGWRKLQRFREQMRLHPEEEIGEFRKKGGWACAEMAGVGGWKRWAELSQGLGSPVNE